MWLLCTGQPSCGKTTLVKKALDHIIQWRDSRNNHGQVVSGFYTDEVLDASGRRVGFDIIGIASGKRGVLARKGSLPSSYPKTGQYSVDVASFEAIALAELDVLQSSSSVTRRGGDEGNTSQIIIIDEIGRMELHSNKFEAAVEKLLQHSSCSVLRLYH